MYKRIGLTKKAVDCCALGLYLLFLPTPGLSQGSTRLTNPIYPMSYCLSGSPAEHATMISETGGSGEFYTGGTAGIPPVVTAMSENNLGVMSVYKPLDAADWPDIIANLSGTGAQIATYISKSKYSDDDTVVEEFRALADMAAAEGLTLTIYPHNGFYVESTRQAIDMARMIDRENVGLNFNLPHALRYHDQNGMDWDASMDTLLVEAMPYMFGVSINGADADGDPWILVLGEGDFDGFKLMEKLVDLGFTGPVALQCYGVGGDKLGNLQSAMTIWGEWQSRLPALDPITGCMDSGYEEFDSSATVNDSSACITLGISSENRISAGQVTIKNGMLEVILKAPGKKRLILYNVQGKVLINELIAGRGTHLFNAPLSTGIYRAIFYGEKSSVSGQIITLATVN